MELYLPVLHFVTGFGLPVAVIFASTGQGKATAAGFGIIGRHTESEARATTASVIGLAAV